MKFAKNRMYVESYIKCHNCGILIFEGSLTDKTESVTLNGVRYCSAWCVSWETERTTRLEAEVAAS